MKFKPIIIVPGDPFIIFIEIFIPNHSVKTFVNGEVDMVSGMGYKNKQLSNGKFVNGEQVENIVKQYVKHNIILFGENMKNNQLISTKNISMDKLKKINNNLDSYLRIEKIHIISDEELRMFLTPKMSIKRKPLIEYIKKRC